VKIFGWAADKDGCMHYRLKVPFDALTARGHETFVSGRMPADWREKADIIVAQRTCMPAPSSLYQILVKEGRRLVFELDDDLFTIDPRHNPHAVVFRQHEVRKLLAENLRAASLVTVTTEALADQVYKYNPNVAVLPNYLPASTLDIPVPTRRVPPGDGTVVVGWGGSPTHEQDWMQTARAVSQTLVEHPHVRMRFLGTQYARGLPRGSVDFLTWTRDIEQHYRRVSKFDVGLAPLTNTTFNKAKSWLKVVEYMMLGVPAIASPLPEYKALITNGTDGFLAKNPADWERILRELVNDAELRQIVGLKAREKARAELTIEGNITKWEQAYASLL
jgi:glycosyltransferase involved in cell wall biosynthesis